MCQGAVDVEAGLLQTSPLLLSPGAPELLENPSEVGVNTVGGAFNGSEASAFTVWAAEAM